MDNLEKMVLLIDADNTQLPKMEAVIREISTHGRIVVKRAYGNWRKESLKNWEAKLKRLAIKAEQQFDYVSGKNATDMLLVIDTLELLHTDIYDAFVIVASDSDYTPLAIRLHESGVYVMGVGEKKTPEAFRNACDEFIFLENLQSDAKAAKPKAVAEEEEDEKSEDNIEEIHDLLKIAWDTYQNDEGYANISSAGGYIKRAKPDFDSRTYGFVKLTLLLKAFPERYEMQSNTERSLIAYRCLEKQPPPQPPKRRRRK